MQFWLDIVHEGVVTLAIPLVIALGWWLIGILRQHGWRTAYAEALLRAVGQGQIAAQAEGMTLFSPQGRQIAAKAGADYLMNTVPKASKGLGITDEAEHAARVVAQIGAMAGQAQAAAQAAAVINQRVLPP